MSVNKLKNIWISNDTTNLDGTYGKVSILNEGKTELKSDTLINSKLAINKNIDTVNDYKLDVNGNINFSGNLYQNGYIFNSGITLSDVQGNTNTFTQLNTFNRFFLKPTIISSNIINWTFNDNNFIMLNHTGSSITFNLPNPTTSDIG